MEKLKDTEKEIMDKYKRFIHPEKPMTECLMCFGFECGEGWFPILDLAFHEMNKLELPKGFEIIQVKEKYGTLRIYVNNYTDEIDRIIEEAEKNAEVTCELCSARGMLHRRNGWLRTLCPTCAETKGYKISE